MTRDPFGRSAELEAALAAAPEPELVTLGLPDEVDGDVSFTFMEAWFDQADPQAWGIEFCWNGSLPYAAFVLDISDHEAQSPASSSPIGGWASWTAGLMPTRRVDGGP